MLRLDLHRVRQVFGRRQDAVVRRDIDGAGREQRRIQPADVLGHVGQRQGRLAIVDECQRVAELQVEVDQEDGFRLGQLPAEIGRQEGGAGAALARHEGQDLPDLAGRCPRELGRDTADGRFQRRRRHRRGQHLAHARPHRVDQEFRRVARAQQDHRHGGMVRGDVLHLRQFGGVAAHAVHQHELGLFPLDDFPHPALAAFEQRRGMPVRFEHAAYFVEVPAVG